MRKLLPSAAFVLAASLAFSAGCNYYEITDPANGDVYYTNERKVYKGSGSVLFKDAVTGHEVTLTGSKIRKMKDKAWKAAVAERQAQ